MVFFPTSTWFTVTKRVTISPPILYTCLSTPLSDKPQWERPISCEQKVGFKPTNASFLLPVLLLSYFCACPTLNANRLLLTSGLRLWPYFILLRRGIWYPHFLTGKTCFHTLQLRFFSSQDRYWASSPVASCSHSCLRSITYNAIRQGWYTFFISGITTCLIWFGECGRIGYLQGVCANTNPYWDCVYISPHIHMNEISKTFHSRKLRLKVFYRRYSWCTSGAGDRDRTGTFLTEHGILSKILLFGLSHYLQHYLVR